MTHPLCQPSAYISLLQPQHLAHIRQAEPRLTPSLQSPSLSFRTPDSRKSSFRSSCFSVIFENETPRNPLAAVWRAVRITRAKVVRKSECNRNNTLSVRFITVALLNVVKKKRMGLTQRFFYGLKTTDNAPPSPSFRTAKCYIVTCYMLQ